MFINKYALTKSGRRKPQSAYIRLKIPQIPNTTFTDYQSHEDTSTEGAKRRIPQNRLTVLSGDL